LEHQGGDCKYYVIFYGKKDIDQTLSLVGSFFL